MTCIPSDPRFRLLDALVGWDAEAVENVVGLDAIEGIRLAGGPLGSESGAIDPYIPPPRIAAGCTPCDWYLATRPAPDSRILVLDGCSNDWHRAWETGCIPVELSDVVAVAVDRRRIALADAGTGRLWVLRLDGAQIIGEAEVDRQRDVAFSADGWLAVASADGTALELFAENGRPLGPWPAPLPAGAIDRIAFAPNGRLWLVMRLADGSYALYVQAGRRSGEFEPATAEALAAAFERTAFARAGRGGFCLRRAGADGTETDFCYDWFGRPQDSAAVIGAMPLPFLTRGQLLTQAVDSGIPRCRWHRIRLDASVPEGTRLAVSVATSETATPAAQGANTGDWTTFADGLPHPDDWQQIGDGVTDALIRQPAGRYLFVRIRLQGDGTATPVLRRAHIDFPRATSADMLPAVYREDPTAGDFTERFLSLFDAGLETVDTAVGRFAALLDSDRAPADALPWLADFLSVTLDDSWDTAARRRLIGNATDLFRRRGTAGGLRRSIELAYGGGADAALTEHGVNRAWGAVGAGASAARPATVATRLGSTRLYSRSRARLTLGASQLGATPVMSYGDPAADPHRHGAFRFSVGLPPGSTATARSLVRLIEGQKPGHTLADVRVGGENGFLLGTGLQLGVDTLVRRPRPMAFGDPNLRLARGTVLGGSERRGAVLGISPLTSPHSATE